MTLLTEQQLQQVAEAIDAVEQKTDAELVTVLARQSDDYYYIPTLWAAVIALCTPGVLLLSNLWLEALDILLCQIGVFVILAFVFRWQPLMLKLVPKRIRYWRASNLARRQFLENNLHHTQGETGLLIFVSEAEHYVEIIADRGIFQHIDNQQWQAIIDQFVQKIKDGEVLDGFLECIDTCGHLLADKIPATQQKNELGNHLVLI